MISIFSEPLYAQTTQTAPAATQAQSPGMSMVGVVLMLAVFFFLVIWPQSRKAKKHAEFLSKLEKGDAVVTQGGVYGRITGLTDKVVTLEIANKVSIRVDRQSIAGKDPFASATATEAGA